MSNLPQATSAPTPAQELAALVAQVADLSQLALDLTAKCIDINQQLPIVVASQVAAAVAELTRTFFFSFLCYTLAYLLAIADVEFVEGVAITPDALEALFPPGVGDYQSWYVVCIGREPGLYPSSEEADDQVTGVPHQFRRKKNGRQEALNFYRAKYVSGQVVKMTEAVPMPVASGSTSS
ncbi:hypothetical protein DFH09DRAFT_1312866 [Mycena vulgaris]|nr:hypothetical protein DFH09DRAFT_1312866 [Mycena vulgaris]